LPEVEKRLWAAADHLWANTGLKPSEFSTPVLGLIFLRYAEKRFSEAEANFLKNGLNRHDIEKSDYQADGVLYLPDKARFSHLLNLPGNANIAKAINEAMAAVEEENEDLKGILPRAYKRAVYHRKGIVAICVRIRCDADPMESFGSRRRRALRAACKAAQSRLRGGFVCDHFVSPFCTVRRSNCRSPHSNAVDDRLPQSLQSYAAH
jgi:hypothetical protein